MQHGVKKEITAPGEYTLVIPKGVITRLGSDDTISLMITFRVSATDGIYDIEAMDNVDSVYDLAGRKLKKVTTSGVYITNAMKVIVK